MKKFSKLLILSSLLGGAFALPALASNSDCAHTGKVPSISQYQWKNTPKKPSPEDWTATLALQHCQNFPPEGSNLMLLTYNFWLSRVFNHHDNDPFVLLDDATKQDGVQKHTGENIYIERSDQFAKLIEESTAEKKYLHEVGIIVITPREGEPEVSTLFSGEGTLISDNEYYSLLGDAFGKLSTPENAEKYLRIDFYHSHPESDFVNLDTKFLYTHALSSNDLDICKSNSSRQKDFPFYMHAVVNQGEYMYTAKCVNLKIVKP